MSDGKEIKGFNFLILIKQAKALLITHYAYALYGSLFLILFFSILWLFNPHPFFAILIGILPLGIIIITTQPVLLGLLFIAFSFFRLHEAIPILYPFKIPLLLSLSTLATLGWHIIFTGKIKCYSNNVLIAFYLFFFLVMLDIPFANNVNIALDYFKSIYIKIGIMTPVLAWLLYKPAHYKQALIMIISSGAIIATITMYNKINQISLVENSRVTIGRDIGSLLGDPNDLALVLLFPFSFTLSLALTKGVSKKVKILCWIISFVIFYAIIATQSRGGLLGIIAVIGIYAFKMIKSKALLITIVTLGSFLLFFVAGISDRQSGGAAEEGIDESAMGRLFAWEAAFLMSMDHPLSGVGLENFYYNYYLYSRFWDGLNHAVHSTWFGVLAESGFLGLFVFLFMIWVVYSSAKNNIKILQLSKNTYSPVIHAMAQGLYSGIVSFCISSTFLTQAFTWPIYILIALTASLTHYIKTQENQFNQTK